MSTQPSLFAKDGEVDVVAQAAIVWLERLGNEFSMPLEGHIVQTYTRVGDYVISILDPANAATVSWTLRSAQHDVCMSTQDHKVLKLNPALVSVEEALVRQLSMRSGITSVQRSSMAIFMKALAGDAGPKHPAPCCVGLVEQLKRWESAWSCYGDIRAWDHRKLDRRDICEELVAAADLLQVLAEAFDCDSGNDDEWLELEQERLHRLYVAQHKKRKEKEQAQLPLARNNINAGSVAAAAEPIDADKAELRKQLNALKVTP